MSWFQRLRNAAAQQAAKVAAKRALEQLGQALGGGEDEEEEEPPESSTEKALKARAKRDQEAVARWKAEKEK